MLNASALIVLMTAFCVSDAFAIHCVESTLPVGDPMLSVLPHEFTKEEVALELKKLTKMPLKIGIFKNGNDFRYTFEQANPNDLDVIIYSGKRMYRKPGIPFEVTGFRTSTENTRASTVITDENEKLDQVRVALQGQEKYISVYSPISNTKRFIAMAADETVHGIFGINEMTKVMVTLRKEEHVGFKSAPANYLIELYVLEAKGYSLRTIRLQPNIKRPKVALFLTEDERPVLKVGDHTYFRVDFELLKKPEGADAKNIVIIDEPQ